MKNHFHLRPLLIAAALASQLPIHLFGQTQEDTERAIAQASTEALKFRSDLVLGITRDDAAGATAALSRLRTRSDAMGLRFPVRLDLALAALDIGQRLIAAGKPVAAEVFLIGAEESLSLAIEETPDTAASTKAGLFERRAYLRDKFLKRSPEADRDLAEAIRLTPDNKGLVRKRELISDTKANRATKILHQGWNGS